MTTHFPPAGTYQVACGAGIGADEASDGLFPECASVVCVGGEQVSSATVLWTFLVDYDHDYGDGCEWLIADGKVSGMRAVAKAIVAAFTTGGGTLVVALDDGSLTAAELVTVVVATVVAAAGVWATPNA